jgi:poly(3-hydroxybutyrate) depolymerase
MGVSKYITPLLVSLFGYAVAANCSAGCQSLNEVDVETTYNVTLAGDRWYLLWFPENYEPTEPAPLILSYHGGTRTAESQQKLDLLSTSYFNKNYIVVYPNGIDVSRPSSTMF